MFCLSLVSETEMKMFGSLFGANYGIIGVSIIAPNINLN